MAAVSRLYNPFRDEKADEEGDASSSKGKATTTDPFGAFAFEINQLADFPVPSTPPPKKTHDNDGKAVVADPQSPQFDPFHVVTPESLPQQAVAVQQLKTIAPKLVIKLSSHEEVTSRVKMAMDDFDTTSEITIEGTVYAQVQCSDALKNAPFALLVPPAEKDHNLSIQPHEKYAVATRNNAEARNVPIVVTIPKQDILAVPIATYSLQKDVRFMPVLVERKITRNGTRVRIAVQIRSRLDNAGDMKDMTIMVAVPEKVNGSTVRVARGKGVWDALKRTIKWKVSHLVKGQSELVVAEADLWKSPAAEEDETPFPVMFRCSSISDSITSLDWKVAQVSGNPSHMTAAPNKHTFRLLHRLP